MTTTTSTSRRSSSSDPAAISIARPDGRRLSIKWSTRADGDFHRSAVDFDELESRRRSFVDLAWTQLDQNHGVGLVTVDTPGDGDGATGDIAITDIDDAVLGCWVGDCAPVVLIGTRSQFAVVHAGWRGLAGGVIQRTLEAFDEPVVGALLGPAIGPCCYEFGETELELVAGGVGADLAEVACSTRAGRLGLDVPAAVRSACGDLDLGVLAGCTGCEFPGFSHRVRRDPQRHVVAVWQQRIAA
jgi:copper oxidase (laccase) domain-containing protein